MKSRTRAGLKTTVIFDQSLIEEIDGSNPFSTRTEFLARAFALGLCRRTCFSAWTKKPVL